MHAMAQLVIAAPSTGTWDVEHSRNIDTSVVSNLLGRHSEYLAVHRLDAHIISPFGLQLQRVYRSTH